MVRAVKGLIRLNFELSPIEKKDPDPNICNIKENIKRTFKSVYIKIHIYIQNYIDSLLPIQKTYVLLHVCAK